MSFQLTRSAEARSIAAIGTLSLLFALGIIGCGMAASPQPPSLQLPKPVQDLTAERVSNRILLHWTAPRETTDRLRIRGPVQMRICRKSTPVPCETVGTTSVVAGSAADYTDTLPAALTTGPLRPIPYEIFAINKHGRSAGPSNAAAALAGEAPPVVQDLAATMVKRGVILHWRPIAVTAKTSVELRRTLLTPVEPSAKTPTGLPPISEPAEQTLRVPAAGNKEEAGTALDTSVVLGRKYRYIAVRVSTVGVGTASLEATSAPSQAVVIVARDTFPPAAPLGLAAVPVVASMNGGRAEVDLSWSANTEPDLAQYRIYRRDVAAGTTAQQIAPENSSAPIVAPAFRDLDVKPGHTYAYSVAAVDNAGNRSPRSAEVMVTVPRS